MKILICTVLSIFIVTIEAKYEFSQTAKDCVSEIKTDEDTLRPFLSESDSFPEDNELVLKFLECILRSNLNDNNELIVNDKLKNYVTKIISVRLEGKTKLAALVGNDCLDHCKGTKGESKGKTAVKFINCVKAKFLEYVNEKN